MTTTLSLNFDIANIDFEKQGGLVPVCVQDHETMQVLMMAFMNKEALEKTLEMGQVTFYSRTKKRLWTKGEESGHFLNVKNIILDCDQDSLLIFAEAIGPTCHTGDISCFKQADVISPWYYLADLNRVIQSRQYATENSYTKELFDSGLPRMAQKVGEEAVEVVIAALSGTDEEMKGETVDLFYHLLVLLAAKKISIEALAEIIRKRRKGKGS
jgi:phosphoribosyl-ATP pyrophosphohydrolase/phosphoribosyl-AMP cyclohydrolase